MSVEAILFDKDGVLVDFDATWCPATARVIDTLANGDSGRRDALAEAAGFDLAGGRFEPHSIFIAGTSAQLIERWSPILPEMPKYALAKQMRDSLTRFGSETVTAYDDVAETLAALGAAGLALGVATNDEEVSARMQLRALRIDGRLSFVAGSDSGHGAKPEPGMLLAFAEHVGVAPGNVMMVGDSTHDLHSARAAGMIAVAVTTGPAAREALTPHADHVIDRLSDLVALAG